MIITFDLENPGKNYEPLIKKIMGYGDAVRLGGSAYLLGTEKTPAEIRDDIVTTILTPNDKLYVSEVALRAAWAGLSTGTSEAIRENYVHHASVITHSPVSTVNPQTITPV